MGVYKIVGIVASENGCEVTINFKDGSSDTVKISKNKMKRDDVEKVIAKKLKRNW
jgi:hypothetical protein